MIIIVIYICIRYSAELKYSTVFWPLVQVVFAYLCLILFRRCVGLVEALFIYTYTLFFFFYLFLRLFILRLCSAEGSKVLCTQPFIQWRLMSFACRYTLAQKQTRTRQSRCTCSLWENSCFIELLAALRLWLHDRCKVLCSYVGRHCRMQKLTRFLERPDLSHCITELGFHIMVAHLVVDVCCQLRSQHCQQKINAKLFFFLFK